MNNAVTRIVVTVGSSGSAGVYFCRTGQRPVHAWPLSARRFPTHIDMVAEAVRIAEMKLGAGNFNPDVVLDTHESRARIAKG